MFSKKIQLVIINCKIFLVVGLGQVALWAIQGLFSSRPRAGGTLGYPGPDLGGGRPRPPTNRGSPTKPLNF